MDIRWRVYTVVPKSGQYSYKTVYANSFDDARAEYAVNGLYTFVWAEPLDDSLQAVGGAPSSEQIKRRLEQMLVEGKVELDHYTLQIKPAESKSVPGPRKPVPALTLEVYRVEPIDADRAMDAVRAMCKGG